jgi:chorismate mutase/prephenate dehydratase
MSELEELRRMIDEVDAGILHLVARRVEIARRIGELKRTSGLPVADLEREEEVLRRGGELAEALKIDKELISIALRALIGICRRAQSPGRVSYLGPRGSFSEEAAFKALLSRGLEPHPMPTIRDVFRAVESGDAEYGVVPVENSIEGGVKETLDLLAETPLSVCGEVQVRISLNLIAKPGTRLEDVQAVMSHPTALAQCRGFLSRTLRNVRVEDCPSTADAVRRALELDGAAAIASKIAAAVYGGEIIANDIQDVKDDVTRFFVMGRGRLAGSGRRKTSVIFRLQHRPGSLHEALSIFASKRINLTRIESRPVKERPWEYLFHVDFEGDGEEDERCIEALRELGEKALFLKILGSYEELR